MTATVVDPADDLPLTIPALLRRQVHRHGDRTLLVCDHVRLSYAEAEARSRRLARGLLASGATKGSHVALLFPNGAEFIVSPGLSFPVLSAAHACGKLAIPGALTPTELMHAHDNGAKLIKIFPCGNVGGPRYLRSLKAPFPNAALIPTGGVNASNATDYIAAGAFALGVGGELIDAAAVRDGNLAKITQSARELVQAVHVARESVLEKANLLH